MNEKFFTVDFQVTEGGRRAPEYTLETDLNGEISLGDFLQFTKNSLLATSLEVLNEERERGFDQDAITIVDGRQGKDPQSVNPLGQIEFVSRVNVTDLLLETYVALLGRSPVLTGRFKSSHYVFFNGRQIANDLNSLKAWAATNPEFNEKDLVRFVNIQPYARKLERLGVTAQRTQTRTSRTKDRKSGAVRERFRQPNGTYFLTARAIKAKYKRNQSIRFGFISGAQLGLSGAFKEGRPGRNSAGRPYLYPTITIYLNERGMR